jgi:hypothetical protein
MSRLSWSTAANSSHLKAADLPAESTVLHLQLEAKDPFEYIKPVHGPKHMWLGMVSRRWRYHYAVNAVL